MVCIPLSNPPGYQFGPFGLKSDGTLFIGDKYLHVPPKELQVLRVLLAAPGRLIDQNTLIERVWRGGEVAGESLTRCIYSLRKILEPYKHFIATVYGKGYRFETSVEEVADAAIGVAPPVRTAVAIRPLACAAFGCVAERCELVVRPDDLRSLLLRALLSGEKWPLDRFGRRHG